MTTLATTAFIHARGLDATPQELAEAVKDALSTHRAILYPFKGRSGLTEPEVAALQRGGFDTEDRNYGKEDPILLEVATHAAILESALSTGEAATRLGVTEGRVRQRLTQRTLYGVHGRKGWRIPSFQFGPDGQALPGWEHVVPHLPKDLSPVELFLWLKTPNIDLFKDKEETPISPQDWLVAGYDPQMVALLATGM